jgi:hypothetical protein
MGTALQVSPEIPEGVVLAPRCHLSIFLASAPSGE